MRVTVAFCLRLSCIFRSLLQEKKKKRKRIVIGTRKMPANEGGDYWLSVSVCQALALSLAQSLCTFS